jgi:hypothetical protein
VFGRSPRWKSKAAATSSSEQRICGTSSVACRDSRTCATGRQGAGRRVPGGGAARRLEPPTARAAALTASSLPNADQAPFSHPRVEGLPEASAPQQRLPCGRQRPSPPLLRPLCEPVRRKSSVLTAPEAELIDVASPSCARLHIRQQAIPHTSRWRPPEAPTQTRESPQGESPPIPAQPGSAVTGLSRRRSRVRVPSLPLA